MLRFTPCAVLACLMLACAPLPYKAESEAIEAENKKNGIKEDEPIILYGYDEDAPRKAPETCIEKGKVEASSLGEKSFPDSKFRKLAAERGGNGVTRIKANGKEDGYLGVTRHFRGMVVLCKAPPAGAPAASASAAPAP
jgi:hypothetical protein